MHGSRASDWRQHLECCCARGCATSGWLRPLPRLRRHGRPALVDRGSDRLASHGSAACAARPWPMAAQPPWARHLSAALSAGDLALALVGMRHAHWFCPVCGAAFLASKGAGIAARSGGPSIDGLRRRFPFRTPVAWRRVRSPWCANLCPSAARMQSGAARVARRAAGSRRRPARAEDRGDVRSATPAAIARVQRRCCHYVGAADHRAAWAGGEAGATFNGHLPVRSAVSWRLPDRQACRGPWRRGRSPALCCSRRCCQCGDDRVFTRGLTCRIGAESRGTDHPGAQRD
mmetsp:Transcript_45261/g.118803  ORF Transcript_45261/g.118803 Transcript_45261/m.118803 type:complete len:289 (+) Transcript_45261:76-942(+)